MAVGGKLVRLKIAVLDGDTGKTVFRLPEFLADSTCLKAL